MEDLATVTKIEKYTCITLIQATKIQNISNGTMNQSSITINFQKPQIL